MPAERRMQSTSSVDSREITGAAALGGFTTPGQSVLPEGKPKPAKPTPEPMPTPPLTTAATEQNTGRPVSTTTASAAPTVASQRLSSTVSRKIEAVKKFYEMVSLDPQQAISWLVPVLTGEESAHLVRAWSSMDFVQLKEAQVEPDGSILATVIMRQPDGSRLRITQLLWLADDTSGLISAARLLSAQRM